MLLYKKDRLVVETILARSLINSVVSFVEYLHKYIIKINAYDITLLLTVALKVRSQSGICVKRASTFYYFSSLVITKSQEPWT